MTGNGAPTVFAAFAVGFVSFISPCVLPLVPGYLSAVSGVSVTELQDGPGNRSRVLLGAVVFCLSFSVVFIALGMTATGLGETLTANRDLLDTIAGIAIIALGIFLLLTPFVERLNRTWHVQGLMAKAGAGGPVVAGMAFAIAWTPCIGPTLAAILAAAAQADSVARGGVLLACYSAGLAIPFILCALAFDKATHAFRWLRDHYAVLAAVSGVILIVMGTLILTGEVTRINAELQRLLEPLGLDFVYTL